MSIIDESYEKFHSIGSKLPINYAKNDENHLPPWININQIQRIRSLYKQYSYSLFMAHIAGLLVLIFNPFIYKTLNATGKSKNLVTLFYRYYYTAKFVRDWYKNKIWVKGDCSYETIQLVKNMHANVSDKQNEGKIVNKDIMEISCADMTITQWAFIGLLVLYPEKVGFSTKREDIELVIHFWAVIGYMLGIEDEYNLCIGNLDTVRQRCQIIMENDQRPYVKNFDKDSAKMVEKILISLNQFVIGAKFKPFIKYIFDMMNIEKSLPITMNRMDMFIYRVLMYILQNLYFNYVIIRFLINQYYELVWFVLKSKTVQQYIANRLRKMDQSMN
uniref:Uncharacterized protein LOC113797982 n=1 Tax=Dermatophagoides pteronyssinus TaxID=6956 RepID=A0A6P6YG82_DERPT|nr:uncharacterized protein LOC113797982 [Dermatophagoides pteronyssinus]